MKQFYSFFPALLFSAGFVLYLFNSNTNTSPPYKNKTICISSETQNIEDGLPEYEFKRLRDPETGKIPFHIHRLELQYASTLPGYNSNPLSKI